MEKEEIIQGLQEAAEWIVEVADHDFEERHKYMSLIRELVKIFKNPVILGNWGVAN